MVISNIKKLQIIYRSIWKKTITITAEWDDINDFLPFLWVYKDRCCRWDSHLLRAQDRQQEREPETRLQNDEVPHCHHGPVVSDVQCAGQQGHLLWDKKRTGCPQLAVQTEQNQCLFCKYWLVGFFSVSLFSSAGETYVFIRLSFFYWLLIENLKFWKCHELINIFSLTCSQRRWMFRLKKCKEMRYVCNSFFIHRLTLFRLC